MSLPYVLNLNGWVAGLVFLFVGAFGAQLSLKMLASIAVKHELPNYSKIAIKAGGGKLEALLSANVLGFMFGSCISYQIIITSLLQFVLKRLNNDSDFDDFVDS